MRFKDLEPKQKEFFGKLQELMEEYEVAILSNSSCFSNIIFGFNRNEVEFDSDAVDSVDVDRYIND